MKYKNTVFYLTILLSLFPLAAQEAVLARVTGQVKISADSQTWITAKQGDSLPPGTVVSTGFKSTALIKTEDAEIEVAQLTRLTLEELSKKDDAVQTTLFLNGGRINTEVSRERVRQDFTVRSPIATASVRGTGFTFDGRNLAVRHGSVLMVAGRRSVLTQGGDRLSTTGSGEPESRAGGFKKQTEVGAFLILESDGEEGGSSGDNSGLEKLLDQINAQDAELSIHVY